MPFALKRDTEIFLEVASMGEFTPPDTIFPSDWIDRQLQKSSFIVLNPAYTVPFPFVPN